MLDFLKVIHKLFTNKDAYTIYSYIKNYKYHIRCIKMKNYYDTLNITRDSTPDDIRKAFRGLAFEYHPDVASGESWEVDRFREIREAYETLIDSNQREIYDAGLQEYQSVLQTMSRTQRHQATRRWFWQRPQKYQAIVHQGQPPAESPFDIHCAWEMTLEESIQPAVYTIKAPEQPEATPQAHTVQIPGQLFNGALLCVKGLGYRHSENKQRGDLWISIRFAQHDLFHVYGSNLHYDLGVYPWQIALGNTIEVPTLDGFSKIQLPQNFHTKAAVRLPNMGVYGKNGKRGDLCINLRMRVPASPNRQTHRLWREIAREYQS